MGWKVKRRDRCALIEQDEMNPRVHRGTFHIGPRHVKHHATKEFIEHACVENPDFASEQNCRVFAQNSHVAIEIYDFYVKLFDPDYETVSVYDERFEVQYLFKEPDTWRSVDYYNPKIEVIPLEDGVDIKKTFNTDYGSETFKITYTIRTGALLKHKIVFLNKTAETKTFRVVINLAGITNDKVKHRDGEEQITVGKHIITPFMIFGDPDIILSEFLWDLGHREVINKGTPEREVIWVSDYLRDIILDAHAQGCKADIIIGNYTLAENESLLIDPTLSTFHPATADNKAYKRNEYSFSYPLFFDETKSDAIEFSSGEYASVQSDDEDYATLISTSWGETLPSVGALFSFDLSEIDIGYITKIKYYWGGKYDSDYAEARLWYYDEDSVDDWTYDQDFTLSDANYDKELTADFADYIDGSGFFWFGSAVAAGVTGATIYIDWAKLEVTWEVEEEPVTIQYIVIFGE